TDGTAHLKERSFRSSGWWQISAATTEAPAFQHHVRRSSAGAHVLLISTRANTTFCSDHAFRFRQDGFVRSLTCCSAHRTSTSTVLARTHRSVPPTEGDSTTG